MAKDDALATNDSVESDDDNVSITSTQYASENSDTEFFVEDILAEDRDMDGGKIYLVQWTGYPMEKCTWEPKENVDDEMLEHFWEEKRRKPGYQPFDFRILSEAVSRKVERHFRRNEARKRLKLPLTEPLNPLDAWMGPAIPAGVVDDESSPEAPPSEAAGRAASSDVGVEMEDDKGGQHRVARFIADRKDVLDVSDDDLFVIDSLSTPAQPKKKKKGRRSANKETETTATNATNVSANDKTFTAGAGGVLKKAPEPTTKGPRIEVSNQLVTMQRKTTLPNLRTTQSTNQSTRASKPNNSTPVPATTLAPNGKKRTFSARKSGVTYGSRDEEKNVFTGGKKMRTAKSQTLDPKSNKRPDFYFPNFRMRHKADVRGRQKEDREIDPNKINKLFPIASGLPGAVLTAGTAWRTSGTTSNQQDARPLGAAPASPPLPPSVLANTARGDQTALKKPKKKSVRFSAPDDNGPPPVHTTSTVYTTAVGATGVHFFDRDENMGIFEEPAQLLPATRSVVKRLALGVQCRPIEVRFSGVPQSDSLKASLEAFLAQEFFLFGHTCLAATFLDRFGKIWQDFLFSGGIASASVCDDDNTKAMLEIAAARLKAMASGLVFIQPTYCIVLYPARCDEWKGKPFGRPLLDDEGGSVFQYLAFSTQLDCTPLTQPLEGRTPQWEGGMNPKIQDRACLMRAFFQLDWGMYAQLLPRQGRIKHAKRNFFLAFPPSATSAMQQMAFWLRSVDPNCVLFLSVNPGAWMAFQDKVVAESEAGIVIVHEVVTWTIRRFPGLKDLLLTDARDCKFWSVSQAILSPLLFPSSKVQPGLLLEASDAAYIPGQIRLVPLFPQGLAVLLTPSFIVTEPQRTFALLEWFFNLRLTSTACVTLVTAGNICEYLRDIADEKCRQRDELYENRDLRSQSERVNMAFKMGIDATSCENHYKAWVVATEICALPQTSEWRVVQADEAIDGNDEQSLVNWFAWWSMVYMDQFRLFYVVGSKRAIKHKEAGRARCRIHVPRFFPGTVADPDARRHMESAINASGGPIPGNTGHVLVASSRPYPSVYNFSEMFRYLTSYNISTKVWKLYGYPVLWGDSDEAYRHGCVHSSFTTIQDWFAFTWPFSYGHNGLRDYQAFMGLFNPIDEDAPGAHDIGTPYTALPRHPWLVVYRMVEPYHPTNNQTELIFWDSRAENRLRHQPYLRKNDLTKAQQTVVDYVRTKGIKKNPNMPLKKVYIGGKRLGEHQGSGNFPGASAPENELDTTMQQLDAIAHGFKAALPPRVTEKGFRRVLMEGQVLHGSERLLEEGTAGRSSRTSPSNGREDNGGGGSGSGSRTETGGLTKFVFHAPRGDGGSISAVDKRIGEAATSRCGNDLFKSAQQVLDENPRAATFVYEFRPTMEWYSEQMEEGRGYGHIHVNSWEAFFNAFRIEAGSAGADAVHTVDSD